MLKTIYRNTIPLYTIVLLYLMFLGFGRDIMEDHIIRLTPITSTYLFIEKCLLYSQYRVLTINLIGNIVMFMPFGGLGLVFPSLLNYKKLMLHFLAGIFVVESLQYFTRLGVFDIDDIIFNSIGVTLGYYFFKYTILLNDKVAEAGILK